MALRSFREGDHVKAFIVSVDKEKRRISLSLKPSHFGEGDFDPLPEEESDAEQPALGIIEDDEVIDRDDSEEEGDGEGEDDDDVVDANVDADSDEDDEDAMIVDEPDVTQGLFTSAPSAPKVAPSSSQALRLDMGFKWSADQDSASEDDSPSESDDDADADQEVRKKKKRARKEIEQDLTADLHTKAPESNSDFERLLLGSPNSSYLWVQYMAFQLQLSEVEKAREIAKRALKTINFREEQEKLNVWTALLNLENVYGTEESLEATFKDSARHNDSKTIHLRLAAILDQSEKYEVREANSS